MLSWIQLEKYSIVKNERKISLLLKCPAKEKKGEFLKSHLSMEARRTELHASKLAGWIKELFRAKKVLNIYLGRNPKLVPAASILLQALISCIFWYCSFTWMVYLSACLLSQFSSGIFTASHSFRLSEKKQTISLWRIEWGPFGSVMCH